MFPLLTGMTRLATITFDLPLSAWVARMGLSLSTLEVQHPVRFALADSAHSAEDSEVPGLTGVVLAKKLSWNSGAR